ncbi:MAG: 1-(5-phosphoribosyl)-5-[(5-phosphoribosylamino)methylideneamino]imidazole-4-carboxamide isomerase [Coriobacteriia bacterium]|nr:1-(5-phosphoribosyl)-5-[(5-phosphoribosylamino)methylideneamino]imidazole-4-carboxamide isomerase [Coriobacteriia bacterium]
MQILPAIDILDGRAVRLMQGRYDAVTVYNEDPVDQARRFADAGAEWIHVVDLDGARDGVPANIAVVEAIAAAVDVPIEVGGGIRTIATLERLYAAGVSRTVLGTTLVREPALVAEACSRWDGIVAGVDARDGMVAIEGWREGSGRGVDELVTELVGLGVRRLVYTDIALDGMQTGPNLAAYRALTERFDLAVVASGGVHVIDDIRALTQIPGVEGVICGRALYEGTLDLAEAIAVGRGEA